LAVFFLATKAPRHEGFLKISQESFCVFVPSWQYTGQKATVAPGFCRFCYLTLEKPVSGPTYFEISHKFIILIGQ